MVVYVDLNGVYRQYESFEILVDFFDKFQI